MTGLLVPAVAMLAALVFCLIRAVLDFRARRMAWAVVSLAVSGLLLWGSLIPIPTHAVKVDLPVTS